MVNDPLLATLKAYNKQGTKNTARPVTFNKGVKISSNMDSSAVAASATTLMARLILRRRKIQAHMKRMVMTKKTMEKTCNARRALVECT